MTSKKVNWLLGHVVWRNALYLSSFLPSEASHSWEKQSELRCHICSPFLLISEVNHSIPNIIVFFLKQTSQWYSQIVWQRVIAPNDVLWKTWGHSNQKAVLIVFCPPKQLHLLCIFLKIFMSLGASRFSIILWFKWSHILLVKTS